MTSSPTAPPLRWLVGTPAQKAAARNYWIRDPVVGALEYLIHYSVRALPIGLGSWLGAIVSKGTRHLYPHSEVRARLVWNTLHPDRSDPTSVTTAMDRLWRNVSRTMFEYSFLDRLWRAGRIRVTGGDVLDRARDTGRPILVAVVHLGNWEVVLAAGVALGHQGSGIYLAPENRFEHALVKTARTRYGARFVAAGPSSIRKAVAELKERAGPFIIFVDEEARGRVQAPAFGRQLNADSNIGYVARLANLTNAVVVPAYCVRQGDSARFEVHFLEPVAIEKTRDKEADLQNNMQRLNAVFEPVVRAHIDQWFYALDLDLNS
ncbi:lysophospholipid acyltransferase family protein [Tardiphaga sp.]|jgi:KDO2-lipid IV(A) lauroyltransferase|uniref:lysophospholipid acyltransferase family protein n=1 Tax=Tardiphaga sp. TaxID=1926292 RepID=UPI0037D9AA3F